LNTLSTTATRRVGLALVAGAMIVGVSACSGSTASTAPSEAPAKTEAPAQSEAPATSAATESTAPSLEPGSVNLGIAYWDTRTYAFQLMKKGAEAIAAVNPAIEMKATAPDAGDPSKLLPLFQALAQTQTDGIVLQTLAADPFYRPVLEATKAGTPIVAIDAPPPADAGVDLFITNDNKALGAMLAKELLKSVPADKTGEIVIGTNGPSVPPLMARVEGMIEEIKAERPDLKIVGPLSTYGTSGSPQENYTAWDGILKTHPDAVAYLAPGAQDAVSMGLVQQRNNIKFIGGGMDLEPGAIEAVKNGTVTALVSPEHWLKGYIAAKILADKAIDGTAIPACVWDTGGLVVNKDNIDAIAARQADDASMVKALAPVADEQIANQAQYCK
jgi:ABC-type sugar transport system substrate-binding protein